MSNDYAVSTPFLKLLEKQIYNEFTNSQQYYAIATHFAVERLPQLATFYYNQAEGEREHALKILQYFVDRGVHVQVPGAGEVRNEFDTARDAIALALDLERAVTDQVSTLAATARTEGDYLGEQFLWGFLAEQREEEKTAITLLRVAERAGDNMFDLEEFMARHINSS
ncbi:ferritin [Mycobacterium sp.]|uniref:ferritin n=1 Tax=Mycobacterium sp. TaxID=1785 RepID=UPI003D0D4D4B